MYMNIKVYREVQSVEPARRESRKLRRPPSSPGIYSMHKTCIFTKPVFTDVNTRYATQGAREYRLCADAADSHKRARKYISAHARACAQYTPSVRDLSIYLFNPLADG